MLCDSEYKRCWEYQRFFFFFICFPGVYLRKSKRREVHRICRLFIVLYSFYAVWRIFHFIENLTQFQFAINIVQFRNETGKIVALRNSSALSSLNICPSYLPSLSQLFFYFFYQKSIPGQGLNNCSSIGISQHVVGCSASVTELKCNLREKVQGQQFKQEWQKKPRKPKKNFDEHLPQSYNY